MIFKDFLFAISEWLQANPWLIFLGLFIVALDYSVVILRLLLTKPNDDNVLVYYYADGRGHVCKCDVWYVNKLKKYFVLPEIYKDAFNDEAKLIGDLEKHGRNINEYFGTNSGTDTLSHSDS